MIISKKLLSEVKDKEIVAIFNFSANTLGYHIKDNLNGNGVQIEHKINIYELTSKMKEWICGMEQLQGICSHKAYVCSTDDREWYSGYLYIKTTYDDKVREEIKGKGDTEFDAVKEHCEWILEQKAKS